MPLESQGRRWVIVQGITSLNLAIFVMTALMISSHWESINAFLSTATGLATNYVLGIVLISLAPLAFSLGIFILSLREMIREDKLIPRKRAHVLSIIFAFVFDLLLLLLVDIWGKDGIIVYNALEFQMPFILLILNVGLLFTLFSMFPYLSTAIKIIMSSKGHAMKISLFAIVSLGLLISPFILIPSNVYTEPLPNKPVLIAHRSGSYLGPENTLEAATVALEYGIAGIELDVRISQDGIPFLMHDDTLERTTNIDEVYPARISDRAETFTLSELMELNAGEWFYWNDPYFSIQNGFVDTSQADTFLTAQIPTLENITAFAAAHDIILNVDFYAPPENHPYFSEYFNICLTILGNAGIDENIWITARNSTWLDITKSNHPNMVTALTLDNPTIADVQSFTILTYDMLNTRMGLDNMIFQDLQFQNIPTNTWTVNAEFRFSQLWCLGVDYVTTDIPHLLNPIEIPFWSMPIETYLLLWILYDLVVVCVVTIRLYRR